MNVRTWKPLRLECGEEGGGHGREGLALARGELGHPTPSHGETGEHLFVEGTLTESPLGGLTHEREGVGSHYLEARSARPLAGAGSSRGRGGGRQGQPSGSLLDSPMARSCDW